ncbi:MAG: hypothetical protein F6K55_03180 [Moorea sp. SIO4A3]|nr:hypothetical protein [Moorena sp. SIO4A3]
MKISTQDVSIPGDIVYNLMIDNQLNFQQASIKLQLTQEELSDLIYGDLNINYPIAFRLADQLGETTEYWLEKQRCYTETGSCTL